MHTEHYIRKSLELHLFFGRIMKEHALFLRAGFTPADADFAKKQNSINWNLRKYSVRQSH